MDIGIEDGRLHTYARLFLIMGIIGMTATMSQGWQTAWGLPAKNRKKQIVGLIKNGKRISGIRLTISLKSLQKEANAYISSTALRFWSSLASKYFIVTAILLCPARLARILMPIPLLASEVKNDLLPE